MTNYLLLYFKVPLEGLSKLAQAQVFLQVNKRLLIVYENHNSSRFTAGEYPLLLLVPLIELKMNFFHAVKARFQYLLGILLNFLFN